MADTVFIAGRTIDLAETCKSTSKALCYFCGKLTSNSSCKKSAVPWTEALEEERELLARNAPDSRFSFHVGMASVDDDATFVTINTFCHTEQSCKTRRWRVTGSFSSKDPPSPEDNPPTPNLDLSPPLTCPETPTPPPLAPLPQTHPEEQLEDTTTSAAAEAAAEMPPPSASTTLLARAGRSPEASPALPAAEMPPPLAPATPSSARAGRSPETAPPTPAAAAMLPPAAPTTPSTRPGRSPVAATPPGNHIFLDDLLQEKSVPVAAAKLRAVSKVGNDTVQHFTLLPLGCEGESSPLYNLLIDHMLNELVKRKKQVSSANGQVTVEVGSPGKRKSLFVQVSRANESTKLCTKQARTRVGLVSAVMELSCGSKPKETFDIAPRNLAQRFAAAVGPRAGISLCPFDVTTLAAHFSDWGFSVKHQMMFRHLLISAGAGRLLEGCSRGKVAATQKQVMTKVEYTTGVVGIKNTSSDKPSDVAEADTVVVDYVMMKKFRAALSTYVAEIDQHGEYVRHAFMGVGIRTLVFGGDGGGGWEKFGYYDAHVQSPNSGKRFRHWYMVDRYKSSRRNMELTFGALVAAEMQLMIDGAYTIVRMTTYAGQSAALVTQTMSPKKKQQPWFLRNLVVVDYNMDHGMLPPSKNYEPKGEVVQFLAGVVADGRVLVERLVTAEVKGTYGFPINLWDKVFSWLGKTDQTVKHDLMHGERRRVPSLPNLTITKKFKMAHYVLENESFHGNGMCVGMEGEGESVLHPMHPVFLCRQEIQPKFASDMDWAFDLFGRSKGWCRDLMRCFFCEQRWDDMESLMSDEQAPMRDVHEFALLAAKHRAGRLHPDDTKNVINKPLLLMPVTMVTPFFLHVEMGVFQQMMKEMKKVLQEADRSVQGHIRDPEAYDKLEEELSELFMENEVLEEERICLQLRVDHFSGEFLPIKEHLDRVSQNWHYKDAIRSVSSRAVNPVQGPDLEAFIDLRNQALEKKALLDEVRSALEKLAKKLKEVQDGMKGRADKMSKLAGPLEKEADRLLHHVIGLRGNIYWGDFTGPDIKKMHVPRAAEGEVEPKANWEFFFSQMTTYIENERLISFQARVKALASLEDHRNLMSSFGLYYLELHSKGDWGDERLHVFMAKHRSFVDQFKDVILRGGTKSPTPKFHVLQRHIPAYISKHRVGPLISEEGLEQSHSQYNSAWSANQRLRGSKRKALGAVGTLMARSDPEFEKSLSEVAQKGKRPTKTKTA